jgi:dipeptide/tripeptide permease
MCGIIHVRMEVVVVHQFTWSLVFKLQYVKMVLALESYINIPLCVKNIVPIHKLCHFQHHNEDISLPCL